MTEPTGAALLRETCACLDHPETPHPSGFPWCDGVMRRWPSGSVACDCGDHVREVKP